MNKVKEIGGSVLGFIAFVVAAIVAFIVVTSVIAGAKSMVKGEDDSQPKGLVVERSVYTSVCTKEAASGEDGLTNEQAAGYCQCTYDVGVQRWGAEEFTRMNLELENSNQLTPELNSLVNECLAKVL